MNLLSLCHTTALFVSLWLIYLILFKNSKALSNWVCALFILCIAVWNFTFIFLQGPSSHDTAMFWLNISVIGWGSIGVLSLWLGLVLSKWDKILEKWYFYLIIFSIPIFFIYKQWTGYLVHDIIRQPYGWSPLWSESIWTRIFYAYLSLIPIITFFFGYNAIKKRNLQFEKKRIKLTITSGFIFFIFISLTDIVLPGLGIYGIPPVGALTALIMASIIIYGIKKYRLMTITPAYAASDILATMSDSLILISPDGSIIEVNNAALDLLGYKREEIIGSPATILFPEEIVKFQDKSDLSDRQQFFLLTKQREEIPVSFSASTMKDKTGELLGIVYVARDMREILMLQKKEKELKAEKAWTEALQEKALDLQEAYDKLRETQTQLVHSEKMAAVGQLAGGVAHEINNPLGVILGFAQSLVKRIKEDDYLYKPLKSIEREALRCRWLVGDLLTFSRVEKTMSEEIDINQAIDETLSFIEARAKIQNITIFKEYGKGLPRIFANKNQIQQVVVNLCNNAIDAMSDGGNLRLLTREEGDCISVAVSDTGKGISEEVKKHLFEPFFTTKEIGKGTGLGLSLCYEIIRNHNGAIEVKSEMNNGTVFTIKFPAGRTDNDVKLSGSGK